MTEGTLTHSNPPGYSESEYPTVLEDNWRMHRDSQWMYNVGERHFFHISSGTVVPNTRTGKRAWSEDSVDKEYIPPTKIQAVLSDNRDVLLEDTPSVTQNEDDDVDIDLFQDLVTGMFQKKGMKEGNCEDRVIEKVRIPLDYIQSSASCVLVGALDGHGGSACVDYVMKQLPVSILSVIRNPMKRKPPPANTTADSDNLQTVLSKAFQVTDKNYISVAKRTKDNSGSTIVLAVFFGPDSTDGSLRVLLGSLGDSRVILYRKSDASDTSLILPHATAKSHKPEHPSEAKRVMMEGGQIVKMQGATRVVKRLNATNTVGLAVSRAFGDLIMKEPKPIVSAVPEFTEVQIDLDLDQFVVLGTDGVFDFVSDKEVGDLVSKSTGRTKEALEKTAETIVNLAIARGSMDDCTCMIIDFAWAQRERDVRDSKITTGDNNLDDDIFQL